MTKIEFIKRVILDLKDYSYYNISEIEMYESILNDLEVIEMLKNKQLNVFDEMAGKKYINFEKPLKKEEFKKLTKSLEVEHET